MLEFIIFDLVSLAMCATGTLVVRALTFGRLRTAPLFPGPKDDTPLIGTQTWDGLLLGRWTLFWVGLLSWIVFAIAVAVAR